MVRVLGALLPGETPAEFRHRQVDAMLEPGALARRLSEIDADGRPFRRIYLMGCGRSGTWLLTALFATLGNLEILPKECPFEVFAYSATDAPALLIKRDHTAYQRVEAIDPRIEIAYIVRHPYAVLTSHNPTTSPAAYHIAAHRWLGEMATLQYLVDTARPSTTIVRYEDLVAGPEDMQAHLAERFALPVAHPVADIANVFHGPPEAVSAMHGLRPIDRHSLDRFREDAEKMAYLRQLRPRLGRLLDWVAAEYGYDIAL